MPQPGSATALWFGSALLPEGWADNVRLTLEGGKILRVETGVAAGAGDERHGIAVPGLANLHSHAFQRGMAGLAERRGPQGDNFWSWREVMYRFLDRLTPEDVEAIAAQAYVEMLETGFTRVGEFHYLHHAPDGTPYSNIAELAERIAVASDMTGIALTLLPVFYAHANFGGVPPVPGQRRFINSIDAFAELMAASRRAVEALADARIGVAPHSLRAVRPEELPDVVALAEGGPVHIHAAEQTKEVEDCLAWSGARPVEWLLDHTGVDGRWCVVHATHMSAAETVALARSGAVAGLCPVTEANLGDGVFPATTYLSAGGAFGIGTDSNILIDPAEELRALEYAQRLGARARNVAGLGRGPIDGPRAVRWGACRRKPGIGCWRRRRCGRVLPPILSASIRRTRLLPAGGRIRYSIAGCSRAIVASWIASGAGASSWSSAAATGHANRLPHDIARRSAAC